MVAGKTPLTTEQRTRLRKMRQALGLSDPSRPERWPPRGAALKRRRQRAQSEIESLRGKYQTTNQPVYPIMAWIESREALLAPPDWVVRYIDEYTSRILDLCLHEAPKKRVSTKALSRAIGFAPYQKLGKPNTQNLKLAVFVWGKAAQGYKLNDAWIEVAKEQHTSKSTVIRAWQAWEHGMPLEGTHYDPSTRRA